MKQKTKELVLIKSGDYMLDMSKLVFGGVILVGIMEIEEITNYMLLIFGSIVVVFFGVAVLLFLKYSQNNKKKGV